jgi:hypothetical protein
MPLLDIARSLQEIEAIAQSLEKRLRREKLRPSGSELQCEGELIEARAQLAHRGAFMNVGAYGLGPLAEELDSLVFGERWQVELMLALDAEGLAARDEEAQRRGGGGDLRQRAGGVGQEVLDVVDDSVCTSAPNACCDRRRVGGGCAQPVCERGDDQIGFA